MASSKTISTETVEIPPRPGWMRPAREPDGIKVRDQGPLPDDVQQRRLLRGVGNAGSGVLVSAALHLAILLVLNIWFFVIRPGPSGYVITCEILTDDDGAQTPVNTVVQAALPDDPPPGGDIRLDLPVGGGAGEGNVARLGGGGQGDGAGAGGVGFFGTKAQGNSFVFVVDRSGSMNHEDRLVTAKRELNRAIGTLRPNQRFYVLFYNGAMRRMLNPDAPAGLCFAVPEFKNKVRRWMRPILANGGTEPGESLRTALEMQPDVIFFLTDGEIPEETGDIVRNANFHGTVIHTTALVSRQGETVMQQIAQENGGTYRYIGDVPVKASRLAETQLAKRVRAAEAKLRLAQKFLQQGRPRTGRRWLEKVISEFPGTTQATKAEQLLSAL